MYGAIKEKNPSISIVAIINFFLLLFKRKSKSDLKEEIIKASKCSKNIADSTIGHIATNVFDINPLFPYVAHDEVTAIMSEQYELCKEITILVYTIVYTLTLQHRNIILIFAILCSIRIKLLRYGIDRAKLILYRPKRQLKILPITYIDLIFVLLLEAFHTIELQVQEKNLLQRKTKSRRVKFVIKYSYRDYNQMTKKIIVIFLYKKYYILYCRRKI